MYIKWITIIILAVQNEIEFHPKEGSDSKLTRSYCNVKDYRRAISRDPQVDQKYNLIRG